ncbi:MAG: TauD/TfdA family dioxygenase [Rhodospirillaceae bacterium]
MRFEVRKFDAPLGAEICGIDMREPLDPENRDRLYQAWLDNICLVYRDQNLSKDEQISVAGYFGQVGERATPKDRRNEDNHGYDGTIMMVSNERDAQGNYTGSLPDGEMWWHHDMSYRPEPHKATFLHGLQIPSSGGETCISNMYLAFEHVPQALKQKLCGRKVLQAYDFALIGRVDLDEHGLENIQHQWQPIFVRHPETGRIALYVSRLISARIEGLEADESSDILEQLYEISENSAVVYEHSWRLGDLLMWDNRCSIHSRKDFPAEQRRILRRCTVEGGPMVAADKAA